MKSVSKIEVASLILYLNQGVTFKKKLRINHHNLEIGMTKGI
jgi:hypothetical protein